MDVRIIVSLICAIGLMLSYTGDGVAQSMHTADDYGRTSAAPHRMHQQTMAEESPGLQRLYTLGTRYQFEYFTEDNFEPWHLISTELQREFDQATVIGRVNYARRFGIEGYQFELDGYPKFSEKSYAYINMGYSIDQIFPDFRTAISYYRALPKSLEGELGFMYLMFPEQDVMMYTGSISWYVGNYYLSLKPYYAPSLQEGQSFSTLFTVRRYIRSTDFYTTLRAGYGTGASGINYAQDIARLSSQQISLSMFWKMNPSWGIRAEIGYRRDEIREGAYRNRYEADLGFEFMF